MSIGIPKEHSDFGCSDGLWALHRSIQISNAKIGIWNSTGAFRFSMLRWALGIPPEHSDVEFTEWHWPFYRSIQILNALMGIRHCAFHRSIQISNAQKGTGLFNGAFRLQMLDELWAFNRSIQVSNVQIGIGNSTWAFGLRMLDGYRTFSWSIQISNVKRSIEHFTGAFRFWMLRRALGISTEHSDFECLDEHWAFHRRVHISNDRRALGIPSEHSYFECQMAIGHSTWAFRFRILDGHWAFHGAFRFRMLDGHWTSEHSDFEWLDWHRAFHRSIQISSAQLCCGHITRAFRFRMLRWAWCIPMEHSDFLDAHLTFHRSIQITNVQIGIGHSTGAFRFRSECACGIPNAHLSVRYLNAPVECQMPILAFEIWMLRWNAQMPIWAFKIHISIAQLGFWHSTRAFRFRMLRLPLAIPTEHSDFKWSDGHSAFHHSIQIPKNQMGIPLEHAHLGDFYWSDLLGIPA